MHTRATRTHRIGALAVLGFATLACSPTNRHVEERGVAQLPANAPPTAPEKTSDGAESTVPRAATRHRIALYYPRAADISTGCVATGKVRRQLPADANPLRFALLSLLDGPTEAEQAKTGVFSPFDQSPSSPSASDLGDRFLDLQLTDGLATADFARAGEMFFLQAACPSSMVTSAIEQTLLQFDDVREVRFSIEGAPITQWEGDVGPLG